IHAGNRVSYRRGNVTEWYVKGPLGLEQGFTFAKRTGSPRLTVTQTLGGDLTPRQHGQAIEFGNGLRDSGLHADDAHGRKLPARMSLSGRTLVLRVDAGNARYPVTIDPLFVVQQKLAPDNANLNAHFGKTLALSADGNTALIGAPGDSGAGIDGTVWAFTRVGSTWTQEQRLTPNDQTTGADFGWSGALSAGGNTALIGGPADTASQRAGRLVTP